MKKIFSMIMMAMSAIAMMGQQPVITFEKTEHDFGKINEADGRVSVVFSFKNEGMAPLVLSNVRASCGCTTPTWTKEPVEPGQTGTITVTYNPNGRPGRFQKTVTITSNASEPTKKVYIKGEVIPKQAKPANQYKVAVGALNMKTTVLDLGTIIKGENKTGELEYTNQTKEDHKVELATNGQTDALLIYQTTLEIIKPNEVGKFVFAANTSKSKLYGPVEVNAYVVIDGKKDISAPYKLTVKADIVEDFSKLTPEQKQNAPILEMGESVNAGKLTAGKTHKYVFPVKNSGVNPLEIRRAYCVDPQIGVKVTKPTVKSGKKGPISIDINTKDMKAGSYSREIVVITNDYVNPIKKIKLLFTVE